MERPSRFGTQRSSFYRPDTLKQCPQLIEPGKERVYIMFRRDTDPVQGLCDSKVESTLDSVDLRS
ncbi:hypothetical protein ALP24_04220 [Pseudomonas syringae pv. aptata]|uniref:Uncharacterized protein n=1 Tax=Pseudomonas syringae pv. aptata TaxID=83167 RepID=A0A3M5WQZ7_PSEAP|nr:hypothetical protein ALQ82_02639 [Pseudomonas syringae pv. pisi]RMU73029.1 hypothetical protein ALP24_04220 [Pseudomonas syringae pv. aptata]RMV54533.1 hypothetical protein ALP08_03341 [Pseudomonas syringae pv. pisi]